MNAQEVFRDVNGVVHLIFWTQHGDVLLNCARSARAAVFGEGLVVGHVNCIPCMSKWIVWATSRKFPVCT